ncbi:ABC transporter permease [Mesorhizobium sp. IMUNJ 23232]|uniref:ABC transporter permease n=1 Tax=Mesorhizobium sp. IMUNJ 23232 TaxID=3376064 RepID=UPI003792A99A
MLSEVRTPTFSSQIGVAARVVTAMILRETRTRFGRNKFGFIWLLLEPMAYVVFVVAVRSFIENRIPFGQNLLLFILSGILTFRMFSAIASRGLSAITANKALLAYPPVKPIDAIVARLVLETIIMFIIWIIFYSMLSIVSEEKVIINYVKFAEALGALCFLSFGVGTFNAVVATLLPTYERIWGVIRFPLLILSGVFYVPALSPPAMQAVIGWNPILHCVEWIRTAVYLTYDPLLDKTYVFVIGALFLVTGLLLERAYRHRIMAF